MFISQKKGIGTSVISSKDLLQLQASLANGSNSTFERLIVEPYSLHLLQLVKQEFPALRSDSADIIHDVFRKTKKDILNIQALGEAYPVGKQLTTIVRNECTMSLPTKENLAKNLKLKRKEFKILLGKLQRGDEELIERFYLLHYKRCVSYLMYNCNASYDEAYSSTMEALIEIRKDLIANKIFYGNLDFYFTKRARSKLYKLNKKQWPLQKVKLEGLDFEAEEHIEEDLQKEELRNLVAEGLERLCGDCRDIIKLYYYEELSLKEIAEMFGKTHDAIRKQATRCRDKLRKHLGEHFYDRFANYIKK